MSRLSDASVLCRLELAKNIDSWSKHFTVPGFVSSISGRLETLEISCRLKECYPENIFVPVRVLLNFYLLHKEG